MDEPRDTPEDMYLFITHEFYTESYISRFDDLHDGLKPLANKLKLGDSVRARGGRLYYVKGF
jgi:hypothetical protein